MANWNTLKTAIADVIKANGNQEITGQVLQSVLTNIVSSFGGYAMFAGVATPDTVPGSPDGSVFYLAFQEGTYPNFGGATLNAGINVLSFNSNGVWQVTQAWSIVQATGNSTTDVMSQKAVTDAINNAASDISIVQTTGNSTTDVMSQKAVTNAINNAKITITQSKGVNTNEVMSQRAVTLELGAVQRRAEEAGWRAPFMTDLWTIVNDPFNIASNNLNPEDDSSASYYIVTDEDGESAGVLIDFRNYNSSKRILVFYTLSTTLNFPEDDYHVKHIDGAVHAYIRIINGEENLGEWTRLYDSNFYADTKSAINDITKIQWSPKYILFDDGETSFNINYRATGYLLFHLDDITVTGVNPPENVGNLAYLSFYDIYGNFLGALDADSWNDGEVCCAVDDVPEGTAYFRVCVPASTVDFVEIDWHQNFSTLSNCLEDFLSKALNNKQDKLTTSDDLNISTSNELSLTDMAKKRLFIDMWNAACGAYGTYNEESGYFELNGLTDITYPQALNIMSYGNRALRPNAFMFSTNNNCYIRTNLPIVDFRQTIDYGSFMFGSQSQLEVVNLNAYITNNPLGTTLFLSSGGYAMFNSPVLKKIMGIISISSLHAVGGTNTEIFLNAGSLEYVMIKGLKNNFSFRYCPKISLDSISYFIENAVNTTDVTVLVHPDVYAKLTGTDDALTTEEADAWGQVLDDAAEKNIQFATI